MTDDEDLYRDALEALVDCADFYPYQHDILIDSNSYRDKIPPQFIRDRKITFVHSNNQVKLQSANEGIVEILELEPPKINLDELTIKINHTLCFSFDLPPEKSNWSKKLTENDIKHIDYSLKRAEGNEFKNLKTFSTAQMCKWTYVTFRFDCVNRRFKYLSIETKVS
jgi:hypothetical protein